jgi:hemerythrin
MAELAVVTVESFDLDFAALDGEHQVQVDLVEALRQAVAENREPAAIAQILEQLNSYTNAHCMAEQLLMRLHAYPEYENHLQEHDRMVEQMQELQRRYHAGELALTLELCASFKLWLIGHIRSTDRALAVFLRQQGGVA